jgi:hypothetical protein
MDNYAVALSPTRASDPRAVVNAVMEGLSDAHKQNALLRAQGIVVGEKLATAIQVAAGLLRLRQVDLKSYLGKAPPADALSIRQALIEAVASDPVAELEAPPDAAGDLRDDALHVGAVLAVVLAEGWLGSPVRPGTTQQRVVLVQVKGAAGSGGRAPLAERAAAAGGAEDDSAPGGDAGRAGHGASGLIGGEVIGGEPALNSRFKRPGLDHRFVPGLPDRRTQVPGAVRRVAVPLARRTATSSLAGQELASDGSVAVGLARGLRQLLPGDDPGLRAGSDVGPVPVAAGLRRLAGVPRLLPAGTRCPTSASASSNCRSARSLPCIRQSSQNIEHTVDRHAIAGPFVGSVLQAAGQLLATAGQLATEENDRPVRKPSRQIDEKPAGP